MSEKKFKRFIAKITMTEKIVITAILLLSIFIVFQIVSCQNKIKEAGGIEQMIIDSGKKVKGIKKKIDNE